MDILITLFWLGFWAGVAIFVFNIVIAVVTLIIAGVGYISIKAVEWMKGE